MKQNQLDRIIKLVRRTGDRFVIMDKASDDVMVLMNLNEYENLLNDTAPVEELEEEEMLNKLNYDISRWQDQKNKKEVADWQEPQLQQPERVSPAVDTDIEDSELEDEYEMPEPIVEDNSEPIQEKTAEPVSIPVEPIVGGQVFAEEDLSDLPEGEEEKFYLEPIE